MKVYVFEKISVYDGYEDAAIKVYADLEKATQVLEEQMETAKKDFEGSDFEETNYAKGDMSWVIWDEGEFCMNHITLTIYESEVQ